MHNQRDYFQSWWATIKLDSKHGISHLSKKKGYEIALLNLETYYLVLSYHVEVINEFILQQMSENCHREAIAIFANTNTLKSKMILKKNYQVDFKPRIFFQCFRI